MPGTLLITTTAEGLQPLGSPAQRSWELLSTTLATRLGPDFGAMLAEPVATPAGDRIDWYTPVGGETVPFHRLAEPDAATVTARLAEMRAAVEDLADGMEQSGQGDDLRLAEALRHALQIPDNAMLHARRNETGAWHPVLVHWAWSRGVQQSVQGGLIAHLPKATQPVAALPATGVAAGGVFPWLLLLGWGLLALLIAAILWLSFAPCALNPLGPRFCPANEAEGAAVLAERAVIGDEIARLERELALARRLCQPDYATQPGTAPSPVPPPVEPTPDDDLVPDPAPDPVPDPAPDPAPGPASEPGQSDDTGSLNETPQDAEARVAERGGVKGGLNFILEWASRDDVDLLVTCPTGEELSFLNRSGCGGAYDVDANVVRAQAVDDPVENVVFDEPRPGLYKVRINLRSSRSGKEVPVRLHVVRRDGPSLGYAGKVGPGSETWTLNINISK